MNEWVIVNPVAEKSKKLSRNKSDIKKSDIRH
jgi:hypothetical protein